MNTILNSLAGLNGLWAKLQGVALKIVGLAGVFSGASQLALEVAKVIQDKSATEALAMVKAVLSGQDPAIIAIGVGLAALGLHVHMTNLIAATNNPVAPAASPASAPAPKEALKAALSAAQDALEKMPTPTSTPY